MMFILGFIVGFCACVGSVIVAFWLQRYIERERARPTPNKGFLFGEERGAILEEKDDPAKKFFNV